MRPLAWSMIVHGAIVGSGALILGTQGETHDIPGVFPVSLVVNPSVLGRSGSPGRSGPASVQTPPVKHDVAERAPSPAAPMPPSDAAPTPQPSIGVTESTGSGSGGGEGLGNGGGGSGNGGGDAGGIIASGYEPPRLLAGALPLDPDKGVALSVPPEIPVRLRVGADGRVKDIVPEIEHLAPAVLDALHRSALAMRFAPARRGGEPVEGWFSMTFVYRH